MKQLKAMQKDQEGGTYVATKSGRVGRISGNSYESMDTTGYSKGKKEFEVKTSYGPTNNASRPPKGRPNEVYSASTTIKREDVPTKIAAMKKGATRMENWTKNK